MRRSNTKRRNDSNLIVCGAPTKKPLNSPNPGVHQLPRPPDPDGSTPSPSLLKALEAVVEAGRRGLLGPAAKAAATAAKPNLNGGNSSGVVCPETQNRIPTVTGQTKTEKKTETVNRERGTLIPLVSPVEGVKNPQATPKEIWICGNSVILSSKRRAKIHPRGLQLGVPASSAYVYWHGIQAMMWDQLVPLLHEMYQIRSCPSIIIIHLGENDLLPDNCTSLIMKIKNDLGILNRAFVDTTLVWSSLLPRRLRKEDQAPEDIEKALKFVNSKMAKYCSEIGAYFLSHELITSYQSRLFLPDSNDLSDEGTDIFIADLAKILKFILDVKG
ncbi:uncharacterized protein [Tiliqua scincoides]|uniref:uncharacterized protein n=1 Tax=Tiliqua scincoides TaxID=71010 RepID=UPI00346286A6